MNQKPMINDQGFNLENKSVFLIKQLDSLWLY